jgi:hypothetical protein
MQRLVNDAESLVSDSRILLLSTLPTLLYNVVLCLFYLVSECARGRIILEVM